MRVSRRFCAGTIRAWVVSAREFIPIAEETGQIIELGVFALERTARELVGVAEGA